LKNWKRGENKKNASNKGGKDSRTKKTRKTRSNVLSDRRPGEYHRISAGKQKNRNTRKRGKHKSKKENKTRVGPFGLRNRASTS